MIFDKILRFLSFPVEFFVDKGTSGTAFCEFWFVPCFLYTFIVSPVFLIFRIVGSFFE